MKVALVVGHKASSKGACNENYNLSEFDYNTKIIDEVILKLSQDKSKIECFKVFRQTTYSDLPEQINELHPDIVLSFHCNAFNKKASGTEVLYYHKSKRGKLFADLFQGAIVSMLRLPDRNILPCTSEDRGGSLLRYTNAPALILEPFFIDNDLDLERASSMKEHLVECYADTLEFISSNYY